MTLSARTLGQGRDLVLLHGWGMNSAVWETFSPYLESGARLTCIDLPGHGDSALPAGNNDLQQWVDSCLQVAPQSAVWLGWSLGVLIALAAARTLPARVTGIIAIAGTPKFVQSADWPHAVPRGTLAQFDGNLRNDYRATMERFLALQVRGSLAARAILRSLRHSFAQRPQPGPRALETGLNLLRTTDLRDNLRRLHCPSLWLLGQRDTLVPVAVGKDLSTLQANIHIQVITGASHAPFLSHPDDAARAIREFMR